MSRRSMVRSHARDAERTRRRIARRTAIGTAFATGAGMFAAAGAQAVDFPVTSNANAGAGTLRDQIVAANGTAGPDTISFAPGVTGTIDLATEIDITAPLAINGPGSGTLRVTGTSNRIFDVGNIVAPDQAVSINGLTLAKGGVADGGAIRNSLNGANAAELTVSDSVLTGNVATDQGGAIYSDGGSLTISGTTLRGNSSADYGGALFVDSTDGDQPTELTIQNSTFSQNHSGDDGGAFYLAGVNARSLVTRTTVTGNTANEDGGGAVFGYGTGNSFLLTESTFSNNSAPEGAGGGFWVLGPAAASTIADTTVTGNLGDYGGGIAIYNDEDAPVNIVDSTIVGNESIDAGGGVYQYGADAANTTTISSSIVQGNEAGTTGPDLAQPPANTDVLSVGFSIIGTTAGATVTEAPAGSNKIGVDPQLGPLADNGGPTQTMLPALSCPAIDVGDRERPRPWISAGCRGPSIRTAFRTRPDPTAPTSARSSSRRWTPRSPTPSSPRSRSRSRRATRSS